jgi:hypothetical protein
MWKVKAFGISCGETRKMYEDNYGMSPSSENVLIRINISCYPMLTENIARSADGGVNECTDCTRLKERNDRINAYATVQHCTQSSDYLSMI